MTNQADPDPPTISSPPDSPQALRAAAWALVQKLEGVHASPAYQWVWQCAQLHSGPYQGPTYEAELAALRFALASPAGDRAAVSLSDLTKAENDEEAPAVCSVPAQDGSVSRGAPALRPVPCPACGGLQFEDKRHQRDDAPGPYCALCGNGKLRAAVSLSRTAEGPAGVVGGELYCYGGCGRRYEDFGLDTILPTPLWNQIAVGASFREPHPADEREGRGGVLCAACIVLRLAKLPGTTVARMTVESSAEGNASQNRRFVTD